MEQESYKYDVALSFLMQDITLATALYSSLSKGLEVFFFPGRQEELAGTDGLESMRLPFKEQSRLNVVLYREGWGQTPWTAVEEMAIRDSCLARHYQSLFFFMVEPTSTKPTWVPDSHIRYNYSDFGLEQAVGAIKALVLKQGGSIAPMTPARRAAIFTADQDYRREKAQMSSQEGELKLSEAALRLFDSIIQQCDEINASAGLQIRREKDFSADSATRVCILTAGNVGMIVSWYKPSSNSTFNMELIVTEYSDRLLLNEDLCRRSYIRPPERIRSTKYLPDLSPAREYGWSRGTNEPFISSEDLASQCVNQFIELLDRDARRDIKRK